MWINLENFIIYSDERREKRVCNSILAIGHVANRNIVIDASFDGDENDIIDLVESETERKITRDWVVRYGDGFTVDTWNNLLLKKYKIVEADEK
jgi:hypothetical protein